MTVLTPVSVQMDLQSRQSDSKVKQATNSSELSMPFFIEQILWMVEI